MSEHRADDLPLHASALVQPHTRALVRDARRAYLAQDGELAASAALLARIELGARRTALLRRARLGGLAVGLLLGLAAATVPWRRAQPHATHEAPAQHEVAALHEAPAPPLNDVPVPALDDAPAAVPVPLRRHEPATEPRASTRRAHRPARVKGGAPADDAPSELSLLSRARAALLRAPRDTLALCAEHRARFAAGMLREERMLLELEALSALGEHSRLVRAADAFSRAYPDSLHAQRVRALRESARR